MDIWNLYVVLFVIIIQYIALLYIAHFNNKQFINLYYKAIPHPYVNFTVLKKRIALCY